MKRFHLYFYFTAIIPFLAAPAYAASGSVKGKVVDQGYQLFLSDSAGNGVSSKSSSFKLRPSFKAGSVSLLGIDGNVLGPVILAIRSKGKIMTFNQALAKNACRVSGTTAVTGFKFGGKKGSKAAAQINLATIRVNAAKGFGYVSGKMTKDYLYTAASASVDDECVPVGAGKLGLTSAAGQVAAAGDDKGGGGEEGQTQDSDSDGVKDETDPDDDNDGASDSFDIDRDGDGLANFYEEDSGPKDEFQSFLFANHHAEFQNALNLHTGDFTQEQIDENFKRHIVLTMGVPGGGNIPVEVDCAGLPYCSAGGTGRAQTSPGFQEGQAFPDSFDSDGNGFGRIDEIAGQSNPNDFFLRPATSWGQIAPGNVLTQVYKRSGAEVRRPLMLEFLFITAPAIKAIRLGENNPQTLEVTYPIQANAPGTPGNCFQHNTAYGHKVEITAYRPQRPGIQSAGEPEYLDMGNLRIVMFYNQRNGQPPAPQAGVGSCPVSSFSTNDPSLTPYASPDGDPEVGLLDGKGDVEFSRAAPNTFTFSLDLQNCTGAANGITDLNLKMRTPRNDNAFQGFCVQRS